MTNITIASGCLLGYGPSFILMIVLFFKKPTNILMFRIKPVFVISGDLYLKKYQYYGVCPKTRYK